MIILRKIGLLFAATLLQLPFHILFSLPWLLLVMVIAFGLRKTFKLNLRIAIITGVAALGIAPIYGAHLSMAPMYIIIFSGYINPVYAIISFLITWIILFSLSFLIIKIRDQGRASG
jgi:hypothetical protein